MKQVININFHGTVVPIETTAYDMLKGYIESLNKHFANEEGKEEIINDIESRIAELFQERIKKGATCITDDDVNAIIDSMGRVEDFEKEEGTSASADAKQQQNNSQSFAQPTGTKRLYRDENHKVLGGVASGLANYFNIDVVIARIIFVVCLFLGFGFLTYIIMWIAVPSTATQQIGSPRKKLFRDPDEKILAGVCSGIGNYFGINAWIPRVLFLIPFISFFSRWGRWGGIWDFGDVVRFTFSPTSLIIYIILWIVIPEAFTTSEKLEMKGEKVDLDSIKNSVMEEMKTVSKKAQSFGSEAAAVVNQKAQAVTSDVQNFTKKNKGGLGDVIAMLAKIFAYFIIGMVCLSLIGLLIALCVGAANIFPLKDFLLDGNWQNAFAWGTLLFFITVPIIGLIIWIIRKITKSKSNSRVLRLTFISLWIIGWASFISLVTSVNRDFATGSRLSAQDVTLTNAQVNKLVVSTNTSFDKYSRRYRWGRFDSFDEFLEEDTMLMQNVKIDFVKSPNDSFHVTMLKEARNNTRDKANTLASKIEYSIKQVDSLLLLDKGISINKTDKFRNQSIFITIYVPVGKQVRINNNFERRLYFNGFNNINDYDREDDNYDNARWQSNVDYIMNADGHLYTLNGKKADGWNDRKNSKIRIDKNGIDVEENGSRTHVGPDGITVTDDESNYRYNSGDRKTDSINKVNDLKKQRRIDSIDAKMRELEKLKQSNSSNTELDNDEAIPTTEIAAPIGLNIFPIIDSNSFQ